MDRDKLYEYLMARARGEETREREDAAAAQEEGRAGALMSSLASAASMAGSIGGKRADASPVADYVKQSGMGEAPKGGKAALYEQLAAKRAGTLDSMQAKKDSDETAATRWQTGHDETARHHLAMEGIAKTRAEREPQGVQPSWQEAGRGDDGKVLYVNPKNPGETKTVELPKGFKTKEESKATSAPKMTGDQFKVAGYGRRLEQAEDVFSSLSQKGYDRTDLKGAIYNKLAPGASQDDQYKQQAQAERNYINAVLRRESGASISPAEFESAEQQYFPRPGDSPQLLQQKALNRQQVRESMKAEASGAWDKVPRILGVDGVSEATPPPKVKVISPDGVPGSIPADKLDAALKRGFRKAE